MNITEIRTRRIFTQKRIALSRLTIVFLLSGIFLLSCSDDDNPVDPPPPMGIAEIEARVFQLINQHRSAKGLNSLAQEDIITREARLHSANMAAGIVSLGHDGFDERYTIIGQSIPISAAAENVATNYGFSDPADQVLKTWRNSQPHIKNIEGNFNISGVGVVQNSSGVYYFTQIFAKTK